VTAQLPEVGPLNPTAPLAEQKLPLERGQMVASAHHPEVVGHVVRTFHDGTVDVRWALDTDATYAKRLVGYAPHQLVAI
jgi:hypothetical protein